MITALEFHCMRFWKHWLVVAALVGLALVVLYLLLRAPFTFSPTTITIERGESSAQVAATLGEKRVVTSALALRVLLRISGGDNKLREGTYAFTAPENVFSIERRLLSGEYGVPAIRLTFIEGVTVPEMARQVAAAFPDITVRDFTALAQPYEGYLFPNTYVFPGSVDAAFIVKTLRTNFDKQTEGLKRDVASSKRSFSDVVTMASLVEKEARTDESRRMVAGILWNRVDKGMRLQVDAVFGYIFDTETYSPSQSDQKVASPYNTYLHAGLPPGPIGNPGLSALEAAANPTKTSYLYYLTGDDNQMHYATTFAGHKTNLQKYIK